jgi:lipopolysaccharide export system permease protein
MKRLQRYIVVEFLKLTLITFLAFIVLFLMVELFENVDHLMSNKVPLTASAAFLMYKIPPIIAQVSPIAVLLAVLLSLGILSRHGEITAIKAGGIRLMKVLLPLFVIGAIISASILFINEAVTPGAYKKAATFEKEWFGGVQSGSFGKSGIWIKGTERIFNIRHIDLKKEELHGLTSYMIDKTFTLKGRIEARLVTFDGSEWTAEAATVWSFPGDGGVHRTESTGLLIEGLAPPEELTSLEDFRLTASFGELRQYIKGLEADGYEAYKYRTDLYGRLAFPLVNLIMIFVGIPFALKTGRQGGIAAGVGLSVVIAFSYWIVFAVTTSLGHSGVLPPLIAASFPNILFLAGGTLMLGYVRQ